MQHAAILFAVGLTTLLLAGPAVAKDPAGTTTTPSDSSSKSTTAPAEKPGTLSMPHHATGRVVSVDKSGSSVLIKDSKGKELNLVADPDTAAEMSRLKAGDQVEVTYKKDKDQMVATKINVTGAGKASRTTK
jgi:Cu/Ag efflux protein CusF